MKLFLTIFTLTLLFLVGLFPPEMAKKQEAVYINSMSTKVVTNVNSSLVTIKEPKAPEVIVKKQETVIASNGSYEELICKRFGKYCNDALIIFNHENRSHNPLAISSTGDYGLMQINCYWEKKRQLKYNKVKDFDCNKLLDVNTNIEIAWANFTRDKNSWRAWTTCKFLAKCY